LVAAGITAAHAEKLDPDQIQLIRETSAAICYDEMPIDEFPNGL
jgi:hypothetical protein